MTRAHAGPIAGFKHCCMLTGEYDGSDRDYFFQGIGKWARLGLQFELGPFYFYTRRLMGDPDQLA